MIKWIETSNLERKIILALNKNPKSITEIAEEIKRAKPTISETIKRLAKQEIVIKTHNQRNSNQDIIGQIKHMGLFYIYSFFV
ncbi:hypothetical protein ES703_110458 [subsurface metagenome]